MIKVLSTQPEKIYLKDISDYIYYKQEKVYTDSQYNSSLDLKREISKGHLIVLDKRDDGSPNQILIEKPAPQNIIVTTGANYNPQSDINTLLNRLSDLEKKIEDNPKQNTSDNSSIDIIINKINSIEDKINNKSGISNEELSIALKGLEEKISQNSEAQSILKKLEGMLSKAGDSSKQTEAETLTQLETYVPSISVQDANTHINLNTRVIEKSDDVSNALDALKKLKNS